MKAVGYKQPLPISNPESVLDDLKKAHAMLESGRTRGKIVLSGF